MSEPADIASGEESAGAILFTLRLGFEFAEFVEFDLTVSLFSFFGLASTRRVPSLGQIFVAGEKCCPHSLQVLSIVMLPGSSTKISNPSMGRGQTEKSNAVLSATRKTSLGYMDILPARVDELIISSYWV